MINGEFKDLAHEHTQKIINQRFRETKTLQEKVEQWQELGTVLAARYGHDVVDVTRLRDAVRDDKSFLQEQADAHGMTNEQYTEYHDFKIHKKAADTKATIEAKLNDEARTLSAKDPTFNLEAALRENRFAKMLVDNYTMETAYDVIKYAKANPNVDVDKEMANLNMERMLRSGVPMQVAYNALHFDELMQGGMQMAAQQTQKQVTDTIQARGMRPKEGAAKGNGGIVQRMTAKDLSPKDLADYNRRLIAGQNPKYEDYVKRR